MKLLKPAASRLPPKRVDRFKYKAICLGLRQGAGKPSMNHRESMEEDDMVMRVGSSLREETNQ